MLREAFEETGLAGLEIVAALGDAWFDLAAYGRAAGVHHRHFYDRHAPPLPATWRHLGRCLSHGDPPILFAFFRVPLADAGPLLIAAMDALCFRVTL